MTENTISTYYQVDVIIDVFRAFTTATQVLKQDISDYFISNDTDALIYLSKNLTNPFFIGKNEKGKDHNYNIPNSPTLVHFQNLHKKNIFHRTQAGATGILTSQGNLVLVCGFINAGATAKYISSIKYDVLTIHAMGYEAKYPSLEDELCKQYLLCLLNNQAFDYQSYIPVLKNGAGRYFFLNKEEYPKADFHLCLSNDLCPMVIRAEVFENYAKLALI